MEQTDITIVVLKNNKLPLVKPGDTHVVPVSDFNKWLENAGCQIAEPLEKKVAAEKTAKKSPD